MGVSHVGNPQGWADPVDLRASLQLGHIALPYVHPDLHCQYQPIWSCMTGCNWVLTTSKHVLPICSLSVEQPLLLRQCCVLGNIIMGHASQFQGILRLQSPANVKGCQTDSAYIQMKLSNISIVDCWHASVLGPYATTSAALLAHAAVWRFGQASHAVVM